MFCLIKDFIYPCYCLQEFQVVIYSCFVLLRTIYILVIVCRNFKLLSTAVLSYKGLYITLLLFAGISSCYLQLFCLIKDYIYPCYCLQEFQVVIYSCFVLLRTIYILVIVSRNFKLLSTAVLSC